MTRNTHDSSDGRHATDLPTNSSLPATPPPRSLPASRVSLPAALDALYQLVTVCNTGHIRWKPGTRGEIMAREALHAARLVLLASDKYKRDAALLGNESEGTP